MKKLILVIFLIVVCVVVIMYVGRNLERSSNGNTVDYQTQNNIAEKSISLDEAKSIALKEAGLTEADFIKAEQDFDDGRKVYEIEFRSGDRKWEYNIDAENGNVLAYDIDDKYITNTDGNVITASAAEDIALNMAKTTRDSVSHIKSEIDRDNGKTVYEVEFWTGNKEYKYDIDAITGEVLSADVD